MNLRYMFLLLLAINSLSYSQLPSKKRYDIQDIMRIYYLLEKDKSYKEDGDVFQLVYSLAFTKEGAMRNFTQFSAQIGAVIGKPID